MCLWSEDVRYSSMNRRTFLAWLGFGSVVKAIAPSPDPKPEYTFPLVITDQAHHDYYLSSQMTSTVNVDPGHVYWVGETYISNTAPVTLDTSSSFFDFVLRDHYLPSVTDYTSGSTSVWGVG